MGEVDEPQPIRWERLTNRNQSDGNCSGKCTGHSHVAARPRCKHVDDSRCNLPRGTTRDAISREGVGTTRAPPGTALYRHGARPGTALARYGARPARRRPLVGCRRTSRRPNVHGEPRRRDGHVHADAQMYTASPGAEMGTCMLALARRAATPLVAHVARDHRRRDEHKQGAKDELLRPAHLQASLGAECAQLGCGREAQPCEEEGAPVGKTGRRDEQLHAGVAWRGRGRISLRSLAVRVP